ncbi:MAG: hypothetical protein QNJ62_05720 [Methyloceanibacter sp.]|nr:hypothetical protein [Methyloceanibacter sp.]
MLKNTLALAAASALSLFVATEIAAAGDTRAVNLGPVGPHEPILANVGKSRLLAFYQKDQGKCAVSAVLSTATADGGVDAKRVRVALRPGELFHLDAASRERVVFTCAPDAQAMTVLNKGEVLTRQASKALY